jgi:hypothetical protein
VPTIRAINAHDPAFLRVFLAEQWDIRRSNKIEEIGVLLHALDSALAGGHITEAQYRERANAVVNDHAIREVRFLRTEDRPYLGAPQH